MTLFEKFTGPEKIPATFNRTTTTTDRYGNKTTATETTSVAVLFAPATSTEQDGELVTVPASLYLDGTDLRPRATDTVSVDGQLWRILGDPEVWHGAGVVVRVERFGVA